MKRLKRKADAIRLDSDLQLDANNILSQLQAMDPKLSADNLSKDTSSGRNAIFGMVDDSGNYVMEIYSFSNDSNDFINAVVVSELTNGIPSLNYDIQEVNGSSRLEVKDNIANNGYTLTNGVALTFKNQYTSIPPDNPNSDTQK